MSSAVKVLRLPSEPPVRLDDGPATIALCQRAIRRSHWTYLQIGERAGLCQQTVANIAYGDTKVPRMATVVRILTALGWQVWASEA